MREPGTSAVAAAPPATPAVAASPPTSAAEAQTIAPVPAARSGRFSNLRTFEALKDQSYRWFFFSMLAQFSSMHMQMVVNPWLVYQLTGSYVALGTIALANAIPGLIFGFVGGVVADRAPKKYVVQIGQIVNAGGTAVVGVLILNGSVTFTHLLALSVLQGISWAFIGPARQAYISEIVGPSKLTNAVALNMTALNVTRMGIPAVGGFLIAITGAEGVFFLMAALIFVSMLTLTPVRPRVLTAEDEALMREQDAAAGADGRPAASASHAYSARSLRGAWLDMVEGIRYIRRDRIVFVLLAMNFFIVLMSMPYMQMMAGFVDDVLGVGPEGLGILWSVTGIGSLVGSLAIASMPNRNRGKVFLWSALVLGVALCAFSASPWFWVTAAIMVVVGVGSAGRMSLGNILVMSYTHPSYQGRVMAVFMMEFSLVSLGTFFVGILAAIIGVQWAIGFTAASLVAVSIVGLLCVPRVRDLP